LSVQSLLGCVLRSNNRCHCSCCCCYSRAQTSDASLYLWLVMISGDMYPGVPTLLQEGDGGGGGGKGWQMAG